MTDLYFVFITCRESIDFEFVTNGRCEGFSGRWRWFYANTNADDGSVFLYSTFPNKIKDKEFQQQLLM